MNVELVKNKKAIITGMAGQDGSYLAELLLDKGYEVFGLITHEQLSNPGKLWRINGLRNNINLHVCDIGDEKQLSEYFGRIMPDEVYHLASNVDPKVIFEEEVNTFNANFWGAINLLRSITRHKKECKIYCAGSSLMFGDVKESPQNERTRLNPTTPYGIAKVASFHFLKMYREVYGAFACMGILYNHESPRRDERFLPRKIVKAAAEIKAGRKEKLALGDVDIKRDWSFAGDVVESMWLMLQANEPKDYVIGSGELHSIEEILEIAFGYVDLDWRKFAVRDERYVRKVEYVNLCADTKKAREELGWVPKMRFRELITAMVCSDIKLVGDVYD